MNYRQLAYGLVSHIPGLLDLVQKGTGGTGSAEYCYAIWLRHLRLAHDQGLPGMPRVVAELGPGDSIGVGLCALLCGAQRYMALDAFAHAEREVNLAIFDDLLQMLRDRAPIPGPEAFPDHPVLLEDHAFPHDILDDGTLAEALAPERVASLRAIVAGEADDQRAIEYRAPAGALQPGDEGTVDFLISNAVMEHVVDIRDVYATTATWIRSGGYASHQIDFRSHGLFKSWDGHWSCPDWLWRLMIGRRPYLLNRQPFSVHRALAAEAGFEECVLRRITQAPSGARPTQRFAAMTPEDRSTAGAYLLLRRS